MSASTATRTYTPVITEATPVNEKQQRLYAEGFRGYWVEASGNTLKHGVRITKYLVTMMPGMYLKCPCDAGKHGHPCRHKSAVRTWLGGPRTTNVIAAKPVPQATFACKRETALLDTDRGYHGSIFKSEDHDGNYIPSDHYQHAYR